MTKSAYTVIDEYELTHIIAKKGENLYLSISSSNNYRLLYEDEYFAIYEVI